MILGNVQTSSRTSQKNDTHLNLRTCIDAKLTANLNAPLGSSSAHASKNQELTFFESNDSDLKHYECGLIKPSINRKKACNSSASLTMPRACRECSYVAHTA